jgi:putative peptidoglycan lipid II flippase
MLKKEKFHGEVWTFFLKVAGFFLVLCLLLHVLTFDIVALLFQHFDKKAQVLTTGLLHILINNIFFIVAISIISSAMYACGRFVRVELIIMFSNIVGLIFLVLLIDQFGIYGAAWSFLIRSALAPIILLFMFGNFQLTSNKHVFKEIIARIKYLLAGNIYFKSEIIYDRVLASQLFVGSLSAFNFAQQIYSAGQLVMSKAVVNPFVPRIAIMLKTQDYRNMKRLVIKALMFQSFIGVIVLVVIYLFGEEIIGFILQIKSFDESSAIISIVLLLLGGLWFGGLLGQVVSSTYYAIGDTKTPVLVSVISFSISLFLRYFFTKYCGIEGLAIAISLYYILNTAILGIILVSRLNKQIATYYD